ncbi:MAG: nuclear transport factor 2 family protein [Candidatus Binatia bacterium]
MNADDYFAIQNLINRYADRMDRADFDGCAELFAHADFYLPGYPPFRSDSAGLAAMWRDWNHVYPETGNLRTRHVMTNIIIESDGAEHARSQTYGTVFQAAPGFPLQPIVTASYNDRFAKVDGRWRYIERREDVQLIGDLSHHLSRPFSGGYPNAGAVSTTVGKR